MATNCSQLKMLAPDGKKRLRDAMTTRDIFRLIEFVPSSKAEPFKVWLANLGSERIDEVFDPEIAINRAVQYYRNKGYSDEWIKSRMNGIVDRFKLTDIWKEGGITKPIEFVLLTNEIYKEWSGMKASEYKKLKGIRKKSLRDNMTDIEVALTNIGEIATRDIAREEHPQGLNENLNVAKRGGGASKDVSLASFVAMCSSSLKKPMQGSLVILGSMSIGGTIGKVEELANTLQVCFDAGAKKFCFQCHLHVTFHQCLVIYSQSLIYHFIKILKMQHLKH